MIQKPLHALLAAALSLAVISSCGTSTTPATDGGAATKADAGAVPAGLDASTFSPGLDASAKADTGTTPDTGTTTTDDSGTITGVDSGTITGVDSGTITGVDSGTIPTVDGGTPPTPLPAACGTSTVTGRNFTVKLGSTVISFATGALTTTFDPTDPTYVDYELASDDGSYSLFFDLYSPFPSCPANFVTPVDYNTSLADLYLQDNGTGDYWDIDDPADSTGTLTIDSFKTSGTGEISFKCPNCTLSDGAGGLADLNGDGLLK